MLQLHKLKILNSSKTWPHRENLTTVLKSAPQNYPENALKPQSPWNSFKIVNLCNLHKLTRPRVYMFALNIFKYWTFLAWINNVRGLYTSWERPHPPNPAVRFWKSAEAVWHSVGLQSAGLMVFTVYTFVVFNLIWISVLLSFKHKL